MTAREKIDTAVTYLEGRGVPMNSAAPPHYRFLWAFGIPLTPPHFQTFLGLFLFNATFFGVIFSGLVLVFERHHAGPEFVFVFGVGGGTLVGLIAAPIYRAKAWRLGLPSWSEFPPDPAADEADAGW